MKNLIYILLLFSASICAQDIGGDYYVATDGDDNDPGTYAEPWATLNKATATAVSGDTVYLRGGTYMSIAPVAISNSGTKEAPICFFNYPDESPIIDCRNHCSSIALTEPYFSNPELDIYNATIYAFEKEHIYFKGLTIRNVWQCDSVLNGAVTTESCANFTFENITIHNVSQRAYWMTSGAWGDYYNDGYTGNPPVFDYDTTLFINCDVYDLFDTLSTPVGTPGSGADAWKGVFYPPAYVEWNGCRAWYYSDDAWDWNSGNADHNGAKRVWINSWAMSTNKYISDLEGGVTERNGWKHACAGGDADTIRGVEMSYCLAMFCSGLGFAEIFTPLNRGVYYNNTSYKNGTGFSAPTNTESIFRNNITYGSTNLDPGLKRPYNVAIHGAPYLESHNTWDKTGSYPHFVMTDTVTITDDDFVTSDSSTLVALFTASRLEDGSLPPFPLQLDQDSDLIDMGRQLLSADSASFSLTYYGDAPDIGAFEFNPGISSVHNILTFTFPEQSGGATINDGAHTVLIEVDYGTDVSTLTPTITVSAEGTIDPLSETEQDFSSPVEYTVIAEDLSEQAWTVTVTTASQEITYTLRHNGSVIRHNGKTVIYRQ